MPQYPGSPCARLIWKYSGALSDLNLFEVTMKTDEEQLGPQKVPNGIATARMNVIQKSYSRQHFNSIIIITNACNSRTYA